jgi:hypothetical protein
MSGGAPEFHEDFVSDKLDPLAPPSHEDFDYEAVDAALGNSPLKGVADENREKMVSLAKDFMHFLTEKTELQVGADAYLGRRLIGAA